MTEPTTAQRLAAELDAWETTLAHHAAVLALPDTHPAARVALYVLAAYGDVPPDDYDHDEDMLTLAYDVTAEMGKPYSVLLAGGGPTVWLEAHGDQPAILHGTLGTERAQRHGAHLDTVLRYYVEGH